MENNGWKVKQKYKKKADDAQKVRISDVLQTSIVAEGALEAKSARDCSQKQYFEGRPKPKNEKPIGTKAISAKKVSQRVAIRGLEGSKKF